MPIVAIALVLVFVAALVVVLVVVVVVVVVKIGADADDSDDDRGGRDDVVDGVAAEVGYSDRPFQRKCLLLTFVKDVRPECLYHESGNGKGARAWRRGGP
jgi:hypothetical protein